MGLKTRARKSWLCNQCGHRNEPRPRSRKCQNPECGAMSRPLKRQAKHKAILRTMDYEAFARLSVQIHGGELYACGVCGKPPTEHRKNDRDHCHRTGRARGLACPGDYGCNILMLPWISAATARAIYEAKAQGGEPDAERWRLVAWYLERVEHWYASAE